MRIAFFIIHDLLEKTWKSINFETFARSEKKNCFPPNADLVLLNEMRWH